MNRFFAAVAIAATLGMARSSAQAQPNIDYSFFANKKYMGCLRYMGSISKNEEQRLKGVKICNKNFGYPR